MPVLYNSQPLTPAPFVTVDRTAVVGDDGKIKGFEYTFTLEGTIVNIDSALDSPGAVALTAMQGTLGEQKRLRDLFTGDSGLLEIQAPEGTTNALRAYTTLTSIQFPPGNWVNRCPYTIVLRSNTLIGNTEKTSELENFSENWSVTENEDGTYGLSHQIQARGLLIPTSTGFNNPLAAARQWVKSKSYDNDVNGALSEVIVGSGDMYLGNLIIPLPTSGTNFWNKSTIESVDPITYSWSLTENFIHNPSGNHREEIIITLSNELQNPNLTNVVVNGSVIGYSDEINSPLKYTNAKNYYYTNVDPNIYLRATPAIPSGYTLNPTPTTKQITHEITGGAIRYTASYIAISGATLVSGSLTESITVSDAGKTDIFAQIPIPGRANGPVVQWMKTGTLPERTVSISATLLPAGAVTIASLLSQYLAKPNTSNIINALKPSTGYYYIRQNSEEWNPTSRQYGRVISWVIDPGPSGVSGIPSGLNNPQS